MHPLTPKKGDRHYDKLQVKHCDKSGRPVASLLHEEKGAEHSKLPIGSHGSWESVAQSGSWWSLMHSGLSLGSDDGLNLSALITLITAYISGKCLTKWTLLFTLIKNFDT